MNFGARSTYSADNRSLKRSGGSTTWSSTLTSTTSFAFISSAFLTMAPPELSPLPGRCYRYGNDNDNSYRSDVGGLMGILDLDEPGASR